MPYHNWRTIDETYATSCRIINLEIPLYSGLTEQGSYPASGQMRTGHNGFSSFYHRKARKAKPSVYIRKKIVGYEDVHYTTKKKVYLPNGGIKYEKLKVTKRIPIKVRYAQVEMVSGQTIALEKNVPLFPNNLDYRSVHQTMKPNVMKVTAWNHDYLVDNNSVYGTMACVGPGLHRWPSSYPYLPAVRLGTRSNSFFSPDPFPRRGELTEEALSKLYKKISSFTPSFTTALGESPDLARTIKLILFEGFKLVKDLYRLNLRNLAKKAGGLDIKKCAEIWLTWIYGVSPVINDISGTLKAMEPSNRLWRSFSASKKSPDDVSIYDDPSSLATFYGKSAIQEVHTAKYGCIILGRMSYDSYMRDKVQKLDQYVSTAYELTPFSFMLDWLIDIGGYLSSFRILSEQDYVAWQTYTVSYTDKFAGKLGPDMYNPRQGLRSDFFTSSRTQFVCQRQFLSELPNMPTPTLGSVKNLFDMSTFQRAVNAFAILITRK